MRIQLNIKLTYDFLDAASASFIDEYQAVNALMQKNVLQGNVQNYEEHESQMHDAAYSATIVNKIRDSFSWAHVDAIYLQDVQLNLESDPGLTSIEINQAEIENIAFKHTQDRQIADVVAKKIFNAGRSFEKSLQNTQKPCELLLLPHKPEFQIKPN
jgi:DNA-binding GntR family transcriptional regulator